jgi:hypothetical protein
MEFLIMQFSPPSCVPFCVVRLYVPSTVFSKLLTVFLYLNNRVKFYTHITTSRIIVVVDNRQEKKRFISEQ